MSESFEQPIQMYDPKRDYNKHMSEYDQAIKDVTTTGMFINGPKVKQLEEDLADYVGAKHGIGVASGTDALQIALMALNVGLADEVLTVAHTWISTAEVISLLGAIPVFVDIEKDTYNMDVSKIEEKITANTKVIMPVSLYGHMPDYDRINEIATKHGLYVIEDGAQSFGSSRGNRKSCSMTDIGCTSFFPSKPLGGYGDGGMCFTNDDELALKMRAIKSHGGIKRFHHKYIGLNGRIDALQASVLLVKFKYFNECLVNRNNVAQYYSDHLKHIDSIILPQTLDGCQHAWAQYSIMTPSKEFRDSMVDKMKKNGVNVAIFYPSPLHYQECFNYLEYQKGDLPVTEVVCDQIMNLPCYGELLEEELAYICNVFKKCVSKIVK